ncbi:hypothetical protein ONZ45_g17841 [Pleurotus djamor]|nr:hypothetical protein ONZ45_g17841 [Pleurotus djamor]
MDGFFSFPCSAQISMSISYGGKVWPINPRDMNLGRLAPGSSQCLGGVFDLGLGSSIVSGGGNPEWVVGDVFLKNVYSIYRADPPSIGFAELSAAAGGSSASSPSPSGSSSVVSSSALSTSNSLSASATASVVSSNSLASNSLSIASTSTLTTFTTTDTFGSVTTVVGTPGQGGNAGTSGGSGTGTGGSSGTGNGNGASASASMMFNTLFVPVFMALWALL